MDYGRLFAYLGRCPKCMRQSFAFMLGAWVFAAAIALMAHSPALLAASLVLAIAAAGLWLSHLTAFALRSVRQARASQAGAADAGVPLQPRRQFLFAFARSFALVATATALPLGAASAQVPCNCPAAAPKCCYNYTGDDYVCAPANAGCCAGSNPYYCPSGTSCYGTDSCR